MSARDVYESAIRPLPPVERLRLASMILDDLASSGGAGLDLRDDWSDEDVADVVTASLRRARQFDPDEGDDA
jgi:hypothetical protein